MRVVIIGLGLIGGSLGLALRRNCGHKLEIVGYARREEVAREAVRRGAVDRTEPELVRAVRDCQLVCICTPVRAVEEVLRLIAPCLLNGCVVTDTASTKQQVMKWAKEHLCPRYGFIGGHPMAGKETHGIEVAEAGLFNGCTYCLTPAPWTNQSDIDLVERTVELIGAKPLFLEKKEHDFLVGAVSHLPILLSTATVAVTTGHPDWHTMAKLASSGYRDITRLASGNPQINSDILATNREVLIYWVDEFIKGLDRLRRQIATENTDLELVLSQINKARLRWLDGGQKETNSPADHPSDVSQT